MTIKIKRDIPSVLPAQDPDMLEDLDSGTRPLKEEEADQLKEMARANLCTHGDRDADWHGIRVCKACQLHLLRREWYPNYNGEIQDYIQDPSKNNQTKEKKPMKIKVAKEAVTANTKEKATEKKKPAPVERRKGEPATRATGKRLKLGINQTWIHLFQENEKLAKQDKAKTDEQISEFMYSEFPGRKSKVFSQVATVRSRYNRGILANGEKPKTQSSPYNKEEKPEPKKKSAKK